MKERNRVKPSSNSNATRNIAGLQGIPVPIDMRVIMSISKQCLHCFTCSPPMCEGTSAVRGPSPSNEKEVIGSNPIPCTNFRPLLV